MPSVSTRLQRLQQLVATTAAPPPAAAPRRTAAAAVDTFDGALRTYPGTNKPLHDFSGHEVETDLGSADPASSTGRRRTDSSP
jgi:hypothetical protein